MPKKYNCAVHGKPMYRVRAKVGTDLEGKSIYKNFYGDGKIEAERKRDLYIMRHHYTTPDKTLGQLAEKYTYNILTRENLSTGTISLYEGAYRKYLQGSELSTKAIADINREDIQSFIISHNVKALHKYLVRLFKWLSAQGYCDDLIHGATLPATEPKTDDISVFSDSEVQLILNTPNDLQGLFSLALGTGLRLGELLALRDTDIKDGNIIVARQLQTIYTVDPDGYRHYEHVIKPPKGNSNRIVPIPHNIIDRIEVPNGLLFTTDSGAYIDKGNLRRAWKRHLKRAGVPYKKFHACRATYCTMLCKKGVPLETAAKLMGHSDISITARYYRLVTDEELTSAVKKINDLF